MKTNYGDFDRVEDLSQMNCGDPALYIKGAIRLAGRELKKDQRVLIIVPEAKWNLDDTVLDDLVRKNGFEHEIEHQGSNVILKLRKI